MYKDFNSSFSILAEEMVTRFKQGGVLVGDNVRIRSDWKNNDKLKGRPSDFYKKIEELMASDYPLQIGAVKTERAESQYELGLSPTGYWVDLVQLVNPGFVANPITLPLEVLDIIDNGANLIGTAASQHYDNKEQIKPVEIKDAEGDLELQTQGSKRQTGTKNVTLPTVGKSAKDGRDQVKKPVKKESFDLQSENELLGESYNLVHKSERPAPIDDSPLTKFDIESGDLSSAYSKVKHDQYE